MEMWILSLMHVSPLRKAGASLKIGTSGVGFLTTSRWIPLVTMLVAALTCWKVVVVTMKRSKDRRPMIGGGVVFFFPKAILSFLC